MPKDTTGPKSGSSMLRIATGTPGRAFFCTTKPARSGSVISVLSDVPGVRHLVGVVDVAPHVGLVGPLAQVLGGRLEHDVPAERLARRPPPPRAWSTVAGLPQLDAVGRQQLGQRRPGRGRCPRGARRAAASTSRLAAARVDLVGSTGGAVRGAQPHGVLDDARERAHGGLHGGVRRHRAAAGGRAGDVGDPQQLGHALGAEERRDQRLVGLLADGGQHVGDVLAGDVERRDVDRDHRVDLGVVDGGVEGVLEVLGAGLGAQRDRLVDDQPDRGGGVGGEQAERVGVADDRDPAPARQRLVGEQLGDVEHLLERVDLDHAGLAEHRVDGRGGAAILRTAWPIGTPWVVRPERTAMIGLRSETRRAIRENLRGLPIDSR